MRKRWQPYRGTLAWLTQRASALALFVLLPLKPPRSSRQAGWRALRGSAKGTSALKEHLAEHRREAKR